MIKNSYQHGPSLENVTRDQPTVVDTPDSRPATKKQLGRFTLVALVAAVTMAAKTYLGGNSNEISLSLPRNQQVLESLNLLSTSDDILPGCETTVLILRHCEKTGPLVTDGRADEHCSYIGKERAAFLKTLFGSRWPIPSALYAMSTDRGHHMNFREVSTLEPLAMEYGLDIDSRYPSSAKLAKEILKQIPTGEYCGKLMVVSWKHELVAQLAQLLGCHPEQGCPPIFPDEFDEVWQLKYVYDVSNAPAAQQALPTEQMELSAAGDQERLGAAFAPRQVNPTDPLPGWSIYGSVTKEYFDPLAFSASVGDYPPGGTQRAGRWFGDDEEEER